MTPSPSQSLADYELLHGHSEASLMAWLAEHERRQWRKTWRRGVAWWLMTFVLLILAWSAVMIMAEAL